jgi:hypothetical protein
MIDTKDKNETAVERTQKNKNANKKVVQKCKLPSGKECASITEKLVPPNVFVCTPSNFALKCNKTLPEDKGERICKDFYSLNWDLKSAVIMNNV